MQRIAAKPRSDWRARVEAIGFDFHTIDGAAYWVEDAWYRFSAAEIDAIEDASNELHALCIDVVEREVRAGDYRGYDLDDNARQLIERSWRQRDRAIYGRMDLSLATDGTPKLLEYNADTPTALFEAAVVQWQWFEQARPAADQFNSIHERLIEAWRELHAQSTAPPLLHFAGCLDLPEDRTTLEYLADTATQAGFDTRMLAMQDIGLANGRFIDLVHDDVRLMFKLYPWEWMLGETFASALVAAGTTWIEPAWKLLLSDKTLLAKLWALHPQHPNLLPASIDPQAIAGFDLVRKPCQGREGDGVEFVAIDDLWIAPPDRVIYQARCPLPRFGEQHALIGSWIVNDISCGIGLREDSDAITRNTSRFVPHAFD